MQGVSRETGGSRDTSGLHCFGVSRGRTLAVGVLVGLVFGIVVGCYAGQSVRVPTIVARCGEGRKVLTEVPRHKVMSGVQQLLPGNVMTVDAVVDFGQVVITTMAIDELLDLVRVELLVAEDGQVGVERAEDAVVTEVDDAVRVLFHALHEPEDFGLILGDLGFVLRKQSSEESFV